ncbi:MAG: hypothetical protein QOC84_1021, partial [Bradyrhizobium sp.]|nr:hypothetical protein [Bradyrhizobium sp.]
MKAGVEEGVRSTVSMVQSRKRSYFFLSN